MKIVHIRSFFWSECGKIQTRKNSVFGHYSCSVGLCNYYIECLGYIKPWKAHSRINVRRKKTLHIFSIALVIMVELIESFIFFEKRYHIHATPYICFNYVRVICVIYIILHNQLCLKVVSATFLLVCFLSLNESTCQTRKNVFYFPSNALLVPEKIKF